ncbi:MAG: MarR family transcriptional regulator [Alphaproteobacteria bacterium]|nr:MarR family transcriptional regulator [Alphaproteobacteria bacterium]MCB9928605.1 MarR family transcriptional regulator [Alphaproteobacteria bacterium]
MKTDPETSLGFLVSDVARLLRKNFLRRAQEIGLSQAQWQALAYLSIQPGINQVTLADKLEIQPISLVRTIDRLQEQGLVAREPDPNDRRAVQLVLTDKAQPLLDHMWDLAADTRADAMGDVPQAEYEALITALAQIKQNLISAEGRLVAEPMQDVSARRRRSCRK